MHKEAIMNDTLVKKRITVVTRKGGVVQVTPKKTLSVPPKSKDEVKKNAD